MDIKTELLIAETELANRRRYRRFRQRFQTMFIKQNKPEQDLELLIEFAMDNNLDIKRSSYIYRMWQFRTRLDAMLIRHKFRDPDSSELVRFALKNKLDKTRSAQIYKLYTIDKIERHLKACEEEYDVL